LSRKKEPIGDRLDAAARAGWLYYIAGNTQDDIARKLGVSRQSAQRLVSMSVSEKLIKVRLDHPLANCLALSDELKKVYGLETSEVVPSDPDSSSNALGIAEAAAAELERHLESQHPIIAAFGTGQTLRAFAEQVSPMDCPQHKIVSLVGNIAPDGSASIFDGASRIGDRVRAPYYPMPLPVIATTVQERKTLISQKAARTVVDLAEQADITFVGIGTIAEDAALLRDGFVKADEIRSLMRAGAAGEITGWAFDSDGRLIEGLTNDRVLSVPLQAPAKRRVIGVAMAVPRLKAIKAALKGKLVNGLITSEKMAGLLLGKQ
jgi:DNA-binding transcriptional regulator LsrR (DeoR family)